jgi:hypothetical protein
MHAIPLFYLSLPCMGRPETVAHVNLLYRRQRSGALWFKTSLGKKFAGPHLNQSKLGTVVHTCNPSYVGGIDRRVTV